MMQIAETKNIQDRYFRSWHQILEQSAKSTTLKFALARALTDLVSTTTYKGIGNFKIDKSKLSRKLLDYYWWQEFRYHLRQTKNPLGLPKVIEILRETWPDPTSIPASIKEACPSDLDHACQRIQRECFKEVIPRFHRLQGKNKTVVVFYESKHGYLLVPETAAQFLSKYRYLLHHLAILQWTLWLEKINNTPRIASKVAMEGDPRRGRLKPYLQLLSPIQQTCFYCQQKLDRKKIHVDHVIPWSYVFEDSLWNLVLACDGCNLSKSNMLPHEKFLARLIARNKKMLANTVSSAHSKLINDIMTFPGEPSKTFAPNMRRIFRNAHDDGFIGDWEPSV